MQASRLPFLCSYAIMIAIMLGRSYYGQQYEKSGFGLLRHKHLHGGCGEYLRSVIPGFSGFIQRFLFSTWATRARQFLHAATR